MTAVDQRFETVYRILSGDDTDERACEAIPDSVCTELPRNYTLNVANGACTKLAEQLAGPNLVLPWLLGAAGAPASVIGFLMPIKQVCSLLPQLLVSGQIRRVPRRKWVWATAGGVQAVALGVMAIAVLMLPPVAAGIAVLALLAIFSAASGAGSVAFQDVTGKTVPKGRRGSMLSNRAFVGGILTIAAGGLLQWRLGEGAAVGFYAGLLVVAGLLWAIAALVFVAIVENAGATGGGRNPVTEFRQGAAAVARIPGYRRFLVTRVVLLSVELSMPFYALYARHLFPGGEVAALGIFVLTVGLGNVLSSPVWGRFSDRSSRQVLIASGLLAAVIAALAVMIGHLPDGLRSPYSYALVFVLLGIAEQGVRLGRKTYLVDGAPAEERPLYVAFANTVVGLMAVVGGGLGVLAQVWSPEGVLLTLGVFGLLGGLAAFFMPEAESMMGRETL
ncbi:MAG TPA: MFS transporter [Gammaproteobacteria bacterium]|nr:MFS transporter [Gammaproteobacteria bacterium]